MELIDRLQRAFLAFGGMTKSDSNGRQVVDKWYDASRSREHATFTGDDRPEFSDLDGVEKVCVEVETTNQIDDPDQCGDFNTAWSQTGITSEPATALFTDSWKLTTSTSASDRVFQNIGNFTGDPETFYAIVERDTSEVFRIDLTTGPTVRGSVQFDWVETSVAVALDR